jgi:hypothetical protein
MNRYEADVRAHEWAFILSRDPLVYEGVMPGELVAFQRCMHCNATRRAYSNGGAVYRVGGGEKTTKCPPCRR